MLLGCKKNTIKQEEHYEFVVYEVNRPYEYLCVLSDEQRNQTLYYNMQDVRKYGKLDFRVFVKKIDDNEVYNTLILKDEYRFSFSFDEYINSLGEIETGSYAASCINRIGTYFYSIKIYYGTTRYRLTLEVVVTE